MLVGIERARGNTATITNLDELPGDALISAITLSEMRVGMLLADSDERQATRARFISRVMQKAGVIRFGPQEAAVHADLRVALRRGGNTIGAADLIIAATALANGHSVMTNNLREFRQVPGLEVVLGPRPTRPDAG